MDQKTVKKLEELQKTITQIAAKMVTKDDAKNFLTKADTKNFATKNDLRNFATKDDLKNFATKDDLRNFATKDDLKQLKTDLIEEIKDSEAFIVASADKNKAEKSVVEDLQRRVIKIERKLAL